MAPGTGTATRQFARLAAQLARDLRRDWVVERRRKLLWSALVLVAVIAVPALWLALGTGDSAPTGTHPAAATPAPGETVPRATSGVPAAATAGFGPSGSPTEASTGERTKAPVAAESEAVLEVTVLAPIAEATGATLAEHVVPNVEVAIDAAPARADGAPQPFANQPFPDQRERTGTDGVARFHVPGGHAQVARITAGIGLAATAELDKDRIARVTLRIAPRVWVQGQVVDATGTGVAGAEIVWLPWSDPTSQPPRPWLAGRSNAEGRFTIGLPVGGRIGAQHAALSPSPLYIVQAEREANRPAPTRHVRLTLLGPQGHATGIVYDPTGQPVAGAEIECLSLVAAPRDAILAAPPQRARSAASGSFAIPSLMPGRVQITVRAIGQGSVRAVFEVLPGTTALLDLRLPGAVTVTGRARTDADLPLAGARIWSGEANAFGSVATVSRDDGTFALENLPAGVVELSARHRGEDGVLRTATATLDLQPAQKNVWDAVLTAEQATLRLLGDVVTEQRVPLAGATVVVQGRGPRRSGRTDDQGRFAIPVTDASPCDLAVYPLGPGEGVFAAFVRRGVEPGGEPCHVVLPAPATALVRGRVVTASGEGVAATLHLWHHENHQGVRATTGSDGSFEVARIPPGKLNVFIDAAGQSSATRLGLPITTTVLDLGQIELAAAGSLHGTVVGPDGRPPATVELSVEVNGERVIAEYNGGTYAFAALPPGEHTVSVQGEGVAAAQFTARVVAGGDQVQNIELHGGIPRRFTITVPPEASGWISLALRVPGAEQSWIGGAPVPAAAFAAGASGTIEFVVYMAAGDYQALAWGKDQFEARANVHFGENELQPVEMTLARRRAR